MFLLDQQPDIEVVAQAGSLAEARSLLDGIGVALVDRKSPDGDGHELTDEARRANPGAAALEMRATVGQGLEAEALEAGVEGVIDEKDHPSEFVSAICRFAER